MLTARSFAARHGYAINANHEFVALGVSNLAAGVSQGFAISGADSRTAVNDMVGGKSQLVGIIAALVIALILLFFTAPMAWIPQAALGAVLLMAGWGLIDIKSLGSIRRLSRFEFWLCLLTTAGVLGLGVLPGIVFAVTLAILRLLYSIYQPTDAVLGWLPGTEGQVDIRKFKDARTVPGWWCTASTTRSCSSTPTTSRCACWRRYRASTSPRPCCSMPKQSPTSTSAASLPCVKYATPWQRKASSLPSHAPGYVPAHAGALGDGAGNGRQAAVRIGTGRDSRVPGLA